MIIAKAEPIKLAGLTTQQVVDILQVQWPKLSVCRSGTEPTIYILLEPSKVLEMTLVEVRQDERGRWETECLESSDTWRQVRTISQINQEIRKVVKQIRDILVEKTMAPQEKQNS